MRNLLSLRGLPQYEDFGYTIPSAIGLLVFAGVMSFHTASGTDGQCFACGEQRLWIDPAGSVGCRGWPLSGRVSDAGRA